MVGKGTTAAKLQRAGEAGDGHANNHKHTSDYGGDGRDLHILGRRGGGWEEIREWGAVAAAARGKGGGWAREQSQTHECIRGRKGPAHIGMN